MSTNQDETAQHTLQAQNIQAPTFLAPLSQQTQHAVSTRGTPATLNLDDIFGDCFFTPEGDQIFLSENQPVNDGQQTNNNINIQPSGEAVVSTNASKPVGSSTGGVQQYAPVPYAGGIATTGLNNPNPATRATIMGPAVGSQSEPKILPMAQPPQQRHHLQYAMVDTSRRKAPVPASSRDRKMSDQQKSERRERNREHAKRSRIRKKFLLESLQQSVSLLKEENNKLRSSIIEHVGEEEAKELLKKENLANAASNSLIASNSKDANKVLDDPDFSFIKALQTAQQNFVVTDPSLPDNPIVYATQGFLNLTGYTLDQVLGRNCRFLQGPETDPKAVEKIRRSIEEGTDMSVCLLNYRVDGTTFWNQFFIAALRDAAGNITNYVGVQCKVSDQYAANVCERQDEEFAKLEAQAKSNAAAAAAAAATTAAPAVPAPIAQPAVAAPIDIAVAAPTVPQQKMEADSTN